MKGLEVTLCRTNADCVIGHADGLAVAVWRYHTNAEDVPELTHAARRAHAASGRPIGLVQAHRVFAKVTDAAAWMSQSNARIQTDRVELVVRQIRAGAGPREGARSPREAALAAPGR